MNTTLLIAAWLLPLLLVLFAWSTLVRRVAVVAGLPGLIAAAIVPVGTSTELDWLLLGVHIALDSTGRLFLFFSALVWLTAALYPAPADSRVVRSARFCVFFLLAMAGNMLLILAADMLSFYAGFALMGLSAYGLIIERQSQQARSAGRLYLLWTLLGEVALFCAIAMIAASIDSIRFDAMTGQAIPAAAVALIVFGFGIKLALPGLHFWLPAAYSASPAMVAAVMSGPMFNAGLLGWLRILQPGTPGLSAWAIPLILIGVAGVALGTAGGLLQHKPRAVLGYSSILKTGVITSAFGVALAWPDAAAGVLAAVTLYAMHHLLVKGAFFLGIGEWERRGPSHTVLAGLGLLALALAGAPFSGGAAAKSLLADAVGVLSSWPGMLLMLSAVGTVLLLGRFFWLIARDSGMNRGRGYAAGSLAWLLLLPAALWLPFDPLAIAFKPADAALLVPAAALVWMVWFLRRDVGPVRYRLYGFRLRRMLPARRWLQVAQQVIRSLRLPDSASFRFPGPVSDDAGMPLARAGLLWLTLLLSLLILLAAV